MTDDINQTPSTYIREVELHYRRRSAPNQDAKRIHHSGDVARTVRALIGSRMTESLLVLALDARNQVIGYHEVSRGGVAQASVAVADVFRYPLIAGAVGVIVAHNHPSGSVAPSDDDVAITRRIVEAGKLLGLHVLDHVIVTDEASFSFLDAGSLAGVGVL